jgi:hypothetical protein
MLEVEEFHLASRKGDELGPARSQLDDGSITSHSKASLGNPVIFPHRADRRLIPSDPAFAFRG